MKRNLQGRAASLAAHFETRPAPHEGTPRPSPNRRGLGGSSEETSAWSQGSRRIPASRGSASLPASLLNHKSAQIRDRFTHCCFRNVSPLRFKIHFCFFNPSHLTSSPFIFFIFFLVLLLFFFFFYQQPSAAPGGRFAPSARALCKELAARGAGQGNSFWRGKTKHKRRRRGRRARSPR